MAQGTRTAYWYPGSVLAAICLLSACQRSPDAISEPGNNDGPNTPPVLLGNPANSVKVGEAYEFQPDASDADGDELTFDIQNKPGWAGFDTTTGHFSGLPLLGSEGLYSDVTIAASDGIDTSSLAFSVTVTSIGSASVMLNWTPPTQNEDGSTLTDLAGYYIHYGETQGTYPNSIRIDNPSVSTYIVDNLTPNLYYFVATSFNESEIESQFSNEVVRIAN